MINTENYIGKKIDQFTIEEFIAKGAMGMVFRAFDSVLARTVALKLIPRTPDENASEIELINREEARKRLIQEAKAAGKLTHPNIVTIHNYGETSEFQYICMEYIKGRTLAEILKTWGSMPLNETLPILEQILLALEEADKEGIVHRDIKPSNIMVLDDGRVKVMDFGIAKLPTLSMTVTGMVLGTPYYMSPEQISGRRVDIRSDIFSLGAVFYEMLTGAKPFDAENTATLTYKIVQVDPIPLHVIDAHIPKAIWEIVSKALAKDPAKRFQHPPEMLEAIRSLSKPRQPHPDEATILAPPPASFEKTVLAEGMQTGPSGETPKPAPPVEKPALSPKEEEKPAKVPVGQENRKGSAWFVLVLLLIAGGGSFAYWYFSGPPKDTGRVTTSTMPPVQQTQPPATVPPATTAPPTVPPATQPPATLPPVSQYPAQEPPADVTPQKPNVETLLAEAGRNLTSNPDLAKKQLEEALSQDPNHYYSLLTMARLLSYRKDYNGAIPFYKRAIAVNDRAADAYFELGSLYVAQSDWNAAIQALEASLALSPPNRADVLANLGFCLMSKGNNVQAQIYLKQSLELDPGNMLAKATLTNLQNAAKPAQKTTTTPPPAKPPAQTSGIRLEGNYSVAGTNQNGSQYKGTAVIRRSGDRYSISWNIAGQSFSGSGTLAGRILTIHWKGASGGGVVIYGVNNNGTLRGRWSDGKGSETLTPIK